MKKVNKSGKRMYSDAYIDVATSNQSARLICVIVALSLQGLRDVTSITCIDGDLFHYTRDKQKFFARMKGNDIEERGPLV